MFLKSRVHCKGSFNNYVDKMRGEGVKNYNIEMNVWNGMDHCFGVISEDGETIYSWGLINAVDVLQWQSDQDWKTLFEDREPYDSPKCPYKIQPENQGKDF
jgi:hypothetical protein